MTQTLRRERRKRFAEIIRKAVYAYYKAYMDETEVERISAELSDAAESRTEKLTPEDYAAVDKKMDAILKQEAEAQSRIEAGTGWRGRELLAPEHLAYGDWYHAVTGWQMYGAKAKPKRDSTAMNEFKAWWENDLTIETLKAAYDVENDWRKAKSGLPQNITHPRELTAKAKALQAAPVKVQDTNLRPELQKFTPQDTTEFIPRPK